MTIDNLLKFELMTSMSKLKITETQGLGTKTQILGTIAEMIKISSKDN